MIDKSRLIATGSDWSFEHLEALDRACAAHARHYRLDTFPNQIELITSEQMLDAYSSVGLPVNYHHWSFGKEFLANQKGYQTGEQGLAYEIVINSNPCISYLMENNSLAMQALVIAHACYGHNSFFKGNYLFRQWTQPEAILDYMVFARNYVAECEELYGYDRVERTLDALHALRDHGVDRYKRPGKLDSMRERKEQAKRLQAAQERMRQSEYYSLVPQLAETATAERIFPEQPEENLLYFIEKHAPRLEPWQRELTRIVRKIAQYFYPQRQTKVMNEGWATFWHHRILNDMYDQDQIDEGILLECMHSHTNVIAQRAFSQFNPYALGFAMFTDIRRVCEKPTEEDHRHLPAVAGQDWLAVLHDAMQNYRDESFILQFLSPKVLRDFKLMHIHTDQDDEAWDVKATASVEGFEEV
ncbi:MAG: SpoVR family protein, partial [Pseudomonadota bacterium]|nr:SpoVR family protein [Pseudomonadota bacterium]